MHAFAAEESAEDGDVAQSGDFVGDIGDAIVDQAGDDEALAILEFEFGFSFARAESGDGRTRNGDGIGEVEGTNLRGDVEVDAAVGLNDGRELEADSEFAKLNRNRGKTGSVWLNYGEGKFAASEEAGFLAIECDEVGLGKNLKEVFRLQGLDDGAEIDLRIKEEEVKEVADGGGGGGDSAAAGGARNGACRYTAKLPGLDVCQWCCRLRWKTC